MEEKKTCCFFGHRKIEATDEVRRKIYEIAEEMIVHKGVETFLFGSKSDFDKLCLSVVTQLKEKYSQIRRIYIRAEFQYINDDYKAYLLQNYEDTYYPEQLSGAGRAVYIKRNQIMIDRADMCVVYYKSSENSGKTKSGTAIAYAYAQKKKKDIINVACFCEASA